MTGSASHECGVTVPSDAVEAAVYAHEDPELVQAASLAVASPATKLADVHIACVDAAV